MPPLPETITLPKLKRIEFLSPVPPIRQDPVQQLIVALTMVRLFQVAFESGRGVTLTDVDGNTYIHFSSGIYITNWGHGHPKITGMTVKYARLLQNCHDFNTEIKTRLLEELVKITPGDLNNVQLREQGEILLNSMRHLGKSHPSKKMYLSAGAVFLASLVLNFQETFLAKKLCYENNNSGDLKICSYLDYKCDNEEIAHVGCECAQFHSHLRDKDIHCSSFDTDSNHLDILLFGNVDAYDVLVHGTPEDVEEAALARINGGVDAVWMKYSPVHGRRMRRRQDF